MHIANEYKTQLILLSASYRKKIKQVQESSNCNFQTGIRRIYYITEEYLSDIEKLRKDYRHENSFFKRQRMIIYENVISMYVNSRNYLENMDYEQRKNITNLGLYIIINLIINKNNQELRRVEDRNFEKESASNIPDKGECEVYKDSSVKKQNVGNVHDEGECEIYEDSSFKKESVVNISDEDDERKYEIYEGSNVKKESVGRITNKRNLKCMREKNK